MSNSLGVIKSSTSLDAVKVLQPKMFLESEEARKKKNTETVVKILSPNEISVPINKNLFTIAHSILGVAYIAFAVIVFYFGNLGLNAQVFTKRSVISEASGENTVSYSVAAAFPITWLVGLSFCISGLANILNISLLRKYYFYYLTKCKSPTRWAEYLVTTGLNMAIISRVIGIDSLYLILCLAFLYASGTSAGYWTETIARPKNQDEWTLPRSSRLLPFGLGAIPITCASILLVVQYYTGYAPEVGSGEEENSGPIQAILWITFVLFPQFMNVLAFQQFTKPKNYQNIELAYQVLSLVTRFTIGSILFGYILTKDTW